MCNCSRRTNVTRKPITRKPQEPTSVGGSKSNVNNNGKRIIRRYISR